MVCCCSLAGTKACRTCSNNYFAEEIKNPNTYNYTNYKYIQYPSEWKESHTPIKIKPTIQYWCGNCDSALTSHQKYCHNCGKEIDWSDIFKDE